VSWSSGWEGSSGARSQPDRAAMAGGQPQHAREQHGGAARLVGLDGSVEPLSDLVEVLLDGRLRGEPYAFDGLLAAGARVEGGQPGRLTGEDQVVQSAHQAQLRHRAGRCVDALEQACHLTPALDVLGGGAHQLDVERRATRCHEHVGVAAEANGQRRPARPGVAAATVGRLIGIAHHG
jgi:hypothetical protein